MRFCIILIFFLIGVCALAPSGAQASCVSTSFTEDLSAADGNPLRGFIAYAPYIKTPEFPISMEYKYYSLKATMLGLNNFNWDTFDADLVDVATRKRQLVVRFYMDYPATRSADVQSEIPTFLTTNCAASCVATTSYSSVDIGYGVSPDYFSPVLINALENFIAAFSARYDGNNSIAFVQAGLLGHWGEWHVYAQPALFEAADDIRQRVIKAYATGFKKTLVVVSQDSLMYSPSVGTANYTSFGWHDDDFGASTCNGADWSFQARVADQSFADRWHAAPMGGEVQPGVQGSAFASNSVAWTNGNCSANMHFSWLLYDGLYNDNAASTWFPYAMDFYRSQLGYQLVITQITYDHASPCPDGTDTCGLVKVFTKNVGNAPIYYRTIVRASIGATLKFDGPDVSTILPGPSPTELSIPISFSRSSLDISSTATFDIVISLDSAFALAPIKWAVSQASQPDGSVKITVPPASTCTSAPIDPSSLNSPSESVVLPPSGSANAVSAWTILLLCAPFMLAFCC